MNKNDFRKFYQSMYPNRMMTFDKFIDYQNPSILEERELNVTQMDVFSRMMADRTIFFGSEVNAETANIVVAQLLYLESCGDEDITMYVNSPGGSVYDGYGILDTMAFIKPDVATVVTGMAASMGAMIQMCGTRGKRSILPHARVMIHQPRGGCKGQATEIELEAREIIKLRDELYNIISQRTGQPFEKISVDCERDHWLTAQEAKDYGLVDKIVEINWD